jgi:curved DNA-binding protein CbpA
LPRVNPYEVFGINRDATAADITATYRRLASEWHPDKHGQSLESNAKMKELNAAEDELRPEKRAATDARLDAEELTRMIAAINLPPAPKPVPDWRAGLVVPDEMIGLKTALSATEGQSGWAPNLIVTLGLAFDMFAAHARTGAAPRRTEAPPRKAARRRTKRR